MRWRVLLVFVFLAAIIAFFGSDLHAQVYAQASVQIQSGQVQFRCETQGEGSYVQSNNLGVDLFCTATVDVNWTCTGGVSTTSPWDKICSGPGVQSVVPGQRYTLTGQHYIDFESGTDTFPYCPTPYYDADGFLQLATLDCNGSCDVPGPGLQDTCTNLPDYEVIQTTAWDTAILISPQQVNLGQSQTQTFSTNWLPADQVIWSIASGPGTISANGLYTAPSNIANPQTAVVKACVSTESLNCNSATVNLKPPAPTIAVIAVNGVANAPLLANTTQTVTLTGTNFGSTTPTITVVASDGGHVAVGAVTSYTPQTAVSFSVTTALLAPNGTASFELTAPGGNITSPSIAVHQIALPAPQIMMVTSAANLQTCTGGTEVDGQTTPVYAGQLMLLCSPAPILPAGAPVTGSTWTPQNLPDLTGGYCAPNAYTKCTNANAGQEFADPVMSNVTGVTFYWVVPDNLETMTYTYCINNSATQCATSALATFDVSGPTGNLLLQATMPVDGSGVQVFNVIVNNNPEPWLKTTSVPVPGGGTAGIAFATTAQPPAGVNQSFTWVQVINSIQTQYITAAAILVTPPASPGSGLDTSYPYANQSPTATNDSPGAALPPGYGEGWEAFEATMYLMWDPGLPSGCIPASTNPQTLVSTQSTCANSIPVPLSSVTWFWSGCAVNALSNQTNGTQWLRGVVNGCPLQTLSNPQAAGYPGWTGLAP
jgi:hypothetical protein